MTQSYQPPLTPGYNSSALAGLSGSSIAPTRSPFFSVSNQFLPRNMHDVIRWARYITLHSPVTTEVVRKLSTYPITDFIIDSEKDSLKRRYNDIFKSFRLKSVLHDIGFEYYTVGNVFLSIYFPIHRTLVCPHCRAEHNVVNMDRVKVAAFQYQGECPSCKRSATFIVKDSKSYSIEDMNLIKWDPNNIVVNHNPITNQYAYYYKIPNDIKKRIRSGDRLFIDSTPWALIEAVKNNQDFKFDNNNFFHMKNVSSGQLVEGISIPPLISQFSLVFYQATLRKANESVALDYMAPLRVIFPQAQTGNSDPVVSISLANFSANMTAAFAKHKQDSNHIVVAPVPVGYQAISGEGKALLVTQEIAQAEESLLLSMGVSRELLSGTTNWTSSTVGLRMLANTMESYVGQIEEVLEWIITRITKYLSIETCKVTLTPFKLTDDDNLRQVLLTLVQNGKASVETLLESYGIKYSEELEKMKDNAVSEAVNQTETQLEVDRGVFLAAKKIVDKLDQNNDYRTALGKAQQMAEELHVQDMSIRRQVLNELKIEDLAMYLMVSKLLEEINEQESASRAQMPVGPDGQPLDPNDPNAQNPNQQPQSPAQPEEQPKPQQNTKGEK